MEGRQDPAMKPVGEVYVGARLGWLPPIEGAESFVALPPGPWEEEASRERAMDVRGTPRE